MDETLVKKIMPHSMEAEQSVLGSMLMDQDVIPEVEEILKPEDFYAKQHQMLYEAIVELYEAGKTVDVVSLKELLSQKKDVPEELGSVEFLRELLGAVPTGVNAKQHAQIVRDRAALRNIIRITEGISNRCYLGKDTVDDLLNDAEREIFNLTQTRGVSGYVSIADVALETLKQIEEAAKTKGNVTGVRSGFIDLDNMTTGFHPSDLILIAARPAMGKTAFVLNLAEQMCFRDHRCVAIFSLEMSKTQLVNRLVSQESKVDAQAIRTGNLSDGDWDPIMTSLSIIGESNLVIDDTSSIKVSELRSKCRKFKAEMGLDCIIIDYLQLMTADGRHDSRQNEIASISRALKGLARELDVPIIALSQLSRAVESREDKRPMLSDLRESGAIEQDADMVMFLYRDDYYNKESEEKGVAEVIIAKQRHGSTGTAKLLWLPQYTKFVNREHHPRRD